jgi:hypothetical protein
MFAQRLGVRQPYGAFAGRRIAVWLQFDKLPIGRPNYLQAIRHGAHDDHEGLRQFEQADFDQQRQRVGGGPGLAWLRLQQREPAYRTYECVS